MWQNPLLKKSLMENFFFFFFLQWVLRSKKSHFSYIYEKKNIYEKKKHSLNNSKREIWKPKNSSTSKYFL